MLLNHGNAGSRLLGYPFLITANSQRNADKRMTSVVERSRANLEHPQHGLKCTAKFSLIYRFGLPVRENVATLPLENINIKRVESYGIANELQRTVTIWLINY